MLAAVVIVIGAVALLLTLLILRSRWRAALPASAPPGQVGLHGALVARRH